LIFISSKNKNLITSFPEGVNPFFLIFLLLFRDCLVYISC
jgi:hypothetical protein